MATFAWKKAINGAWTDGTKWTPGGGPQPVSDPESVWQLPSGDALFNTGSSKAYTVSGSGTAGTVTVSHDRVTFDRFTFQNPASADLIINSGSSVTVTASSSFGLAGHDWFGGSLDVDHATLTVHGYAGTGTGGSITLGPNAVLNVSGSGATVETSVDALSVDPTASIALTKGGHLYSSGEIDGSVSVSGNGSTASLGGSHIGSTGSVKGSGTVGGDLTNDGLIEAKGGTLSVGGYVNGAGEFKIDSSSKLSLGTWTDNPIIFAGINSTLIMQPNARAISFIGGFGDKDSIEFAGENITSIKLQSDGDGNTMMIAFSGATAVSALDFGGRLSPQLSLTHDRAGNSFVAFSSHLRPDPSLYAAPLDRIAA